MSPTLTSIRWKVIAAVAASLLMAMVTAIGLAQVAYFFAIRDRASLLFGILKHLQLYVGVTKVAVAATLGLFLLFFYLLSRSSIRYLESVSRTLQQISLGRLDLAVPTRGGDELGELGTNINRMTERLRASLEDERRAERTKAELVTSVSHDLRTPLTSVLGYLELITQATATDPDELRRYAAIALKKARQIARLTDDLFEFTKLGSGAFELQIESIDLRQLLAQLAEEFVPELQAQGMRYEMEAAETSYSVRADGDLLMRVFQNLIANAIRHGRAGRLVRLELSAAADRVTASVVNHGDPIPPDALTRVFDRFYRADPSRTGRTGGSGLGLAIARSIVELHHGEISVRSDAERTAFQVTLPRDPGRAVPGSARPDEKTSR